MQLNNGHNYKINQYVINTTEKLSVFSIPVSFKQPLLGLARTCSVSPLMYFSKPNQTSEYLAVGAWEVLTNTALDEELKSTFKKIRFFGMNSFLKDGNDPSDFWMLPILWLEKIDQKSALNVVVDKRNATSKEIIEKINNIITALSRVPLLNQNPLFTNFTHLPSKTNWEQMIDSAKLSIKTGKIQKVVLARQTTFEFESRLNPFNLLTHVQHEDPGVYHFGIRFSDNESFIGGTPERLFEIDDNRLMSDALAGTLFKDGVVNIDELKNKLMASQKNLGEHQHVVDFISNKMRTLCKGDINQESNPRVIELRYLLHLLICCDGKLKSNISWLDCLKALHPTPAVAGVPTEGALDFISGNEPFNRRWYAGPVGMVSNDDVHMLVAIRSGRVFDNKVELISGAGIVNQSIADDEWDELDAKINVFKSIFNGMEK